MNYEIVDSSEKAKQSILIVEKPSTKRSQDNRTAALPHCLFPLDDLKIGQSFYVSILAWLGDKSLTFISARGKATDKMFKVIKRDNQLEVARIG